jgi:agmatinase
MKRNEKNYAGIEDEFARYEKAEVVLIPVAYDGTSTWQKGADKGPSAFLDASENMELYDIETDSEVFRKGIFLNEELNGFENPDDMVKTVHDEVKDHIKNRKLVTLIGGEHSISIGSIRAFNESFQDLTVLQIDAHADLRKSYEGTPYNHACALHEASQSTNLIQVGIRSMDISEKKYMNPDKTFFAHEMVLDEFWTDKAIDLMTDNVFITIDLDGFDPSILPSTGTPEPGGLLWYETLDFLKRIAEEKNIVGFDIVELCPNEIDKSSDFLAAKLYYKILSYIFSEPGEFEEEVSLDEDENHKNRLRDEQTDY